jgi:hypothetical protein
MKRRTVLLVGALAMLSLLTAASATSQTACSVTNQRTAVNYTTLSSAISAANAGDTLLIRDTCGGNIVINKDLTLTGVRPAGSPLPAIVAQTSPSSNVTVDRSGVFPEITTVVFNKLRISGGNAGRDGAGGGIFISRGADVTLNDTKVSNNRAGQGGGIFNSGSILTLNDSAVRGNRATVFPGFGGGIWMSPDSVVVLNGSRIINNSADSGGGVFQFGSELTLNNSTIKGNTAETGGGVYNSSSTIVLNRRSSITGNTAFSIGGGIFNAEGTVILTSGSTVTNNTPDDIFNR